MADFGRARSVLIIVENLAVPRERRVAISRGGMDPDRVLVVRSGPDLDKVRIVPPDPRLRRGRAHLMGTLGVLNSQDGVDYLIRAACHIVHDRRRTEVGFVLIGDGPDRARLQRLANESEVADAITFS